MGTDLNEDEQAPSSTSTVNQSESYTRWEQIGRHALRLECPSILRPLQEVLDEVKILIIYEHWLANDKNTTKTSEALGITRRRVSKAVAERLRAISSGDAP